MSLPMKDKHLGGPSSKTGAAPKEAPQVERGEGSELDVHLTGGEAESMLKLVTQSGLEDGANEDVKRATHFLAGASKADGLVLPQEDVKVLKRIMKRYFDSKLEQRRAAATDEDYERIQADMDWSSCVMDRFLSPVDWPEKRYTEEELEQMMSSEDERELP